MWNPLHLYSCEGGERFYACTKVASYKSDKCTYVLTRAEPVGLPWCTAKEASFSSFIMDVASGLAGPVLAGPCSLTVAFTPVHAQVINKELT